MNKRRKILAAMLAAFMLLVPMVSTAQIDIKGELGDESSDLSGTWGTMQITDNETEEYVPLGEGLWLLAGAAGLYLLVKSRKTRKATAVAAAALALTLGTTQCKKTEESVIPAGETISISFMAGNGAKSDIDVTTGRITWNEGDKVYVVCNNAAPSKDNKAVLLGGYLTAQTENSQQSEISGEVTVPVGYTLPTEPSFTFYYVGSGVAFTPSAGSESLTFDISDQNRKNGAELNDSGEYMVGRTGAVEMEKKGDKYGPVDPGAKHFDPLTSVLRLNTSEFGANQSLTMDGGNNLMTINLAGDATPSYTPGYITFTSDEDVQISVIPTTTPDGDANVTLSFSGNGKVGSITVTNGIKAGRIYSKVTNNAGYPIPVEAIGFEVEFIDLGLPSGTQWANMNVGAMSETDYGYYLAWGEKSVHYTSANPATGSFMWKPGFENGYANSTYYFYDGAGYTKYNTTDNIRLLQNEDDICFELYGSSCSVPSYSQWIELQNNCTKTWKVNGYEFVGPNGGKIFLPINGLIQGTSITQYDNNGGYYWSKELMDVNNGYSWHFGGSGDFYYSQFSRSSGLGIRAVKPKPVPAGFVDLGLSVYWASENLPGYYQFGATTQATGTAWETTPYYKSGNQFDGAEFFKYNNVGDKLEAIDDAAAVAGKGRIPSVAEWDELRTECTWEPNGSGFTVTSKSNGNSITLPANGNLDGYQGEKGRYWANEVGGTHNYDAHALHFEENTQPTAVSGKWQNKKDVCGIRPVHD